MDSIRFAFVSHPKLRQGYLTVVVSQATRRDYANFAKSILALQLSDDKGQSLWVDSIDREGHIFKVRYEMKGLAESGRDHEALITKFKGKIGNIADRLMFDSVTVKDGAL